MWLSEETAHHISRRPGSAIIGECHKGASYVNWVDDTPSNEMSVVAHLAVHDVRRIACVLAFRSGRCTELIDPFSDSSAGTWV